jgi:hypothetical protein
VSSIDVDISSATLRFGAPTVVERFRDPRGLAPASGSLRLTRMSSEAVMMAWTGVRAGRYVVRASPVSLRRGVWAPVTVSGSNAATAAAPGGIARHTPATDARLADLVPGPRAEVLALWTTTPRLPSGEPNPARSAIEAAWGHYGGHGEALFAPPEVVAAAGPNGTPAAAFDPHSDTALAAWTTGAQTPRIDYAQRTAGPPVVTSAAAARAVTLRPVAATARAAVPASSSAPHAAARRDDGHAVRNVALPALGLLLLAAAAAWRQLSDRRSGPPGGRGPARTRVPRG